MNCGPVARVSPLNDSQMFQAERDKISEARDYLVENADNLTSSEAIPHILALTEVLSTMDRIADQLFSTRATRA